MSGTFSSTTVSRPRVLVDVVVPGSGLLRDALLVGGFALFTAVMAQIAIRIPTTTVPITAQTLGVVLTGAALGSKRGSLSMLVYMLLGMLLLPVFAPQGSVLADKTVHFILPWSGSDGFVWELSSGGYIVGFVLGAYVVGFLAERGWDRRPNVTLAMLVGNLGIYVIGLPWLAVFIASGANIPGLELTYYDAISGDNVLDKTLKGGLFPFIGGDALKLLVAAGGLPLVWAWVRRFKGEDS